MKHGVSTYSFDQLLSTGQLSLAGAIREAGAMGFDGVELANLTENYPYDPEELRAAAREAGVVLVGHVGEFRGGYFSPGDCSAR